MCCRDTSLRILVTTVVIAIMLHPIFGDSACSASQITAGFTQFKENGGFTTSRCPNNSPLEAYARSPCALVESARSKSRTALVIGGNTGSDCIGFARFLSGDRSFGLQTWIESVEKTHNNLTFPEAACKGSGRALILTRAGWNPP